MTSWKPTEKAPALSPHLDAHEIRVCHNEVPHLHRDLVGVATEGGYVLAHPLHPKSFYGDFIQKSVPRKGEPAAYDPVARYSLGLPEGLLHSLGTQMLPPVVFSLSALR